MALLERDPAYALGAVICGIHHGGWIRP